MRGLVFLVSLVTCATLGALLGCGGGSGGGGAAGASDCVVLGPSTLTRITQGSVHQVFLETRFIVATDDFLMNAGIDFDVVLTPQVDTPLEFGGQFRERLTYATVDGVIAGGTSADTVVPRGHLSGSHLPAAFVGGVPATGDAFAFVVAPGSNDQCVDVRETIRFLVDEPNDVPAPTPITPAVDFSAGTGLAVELLDPAAVQSLLQQIQSTSGQEVIAAPTLSLFDTQRTLAMAYTNLGTSSDLLDIVANVVYAGAPLGDVQSGTTLDVRPVIDPGLMQIRLEIRPLSHGVAATLAGTTTIGGNPVTVQMPILAPGNQRTSVSLPDGGTVLLGGVKNLADDGQSGVPLLSRIPYINRLFKNTSQMATETTLLIMVTPRIIIQQEEK